MTRELIVQKALAFGIVALAIAYLAPVQLLAAFVVLGQGHFLAAYYYQWKAGKTKTKWVVVYATCAVALIILAETTHRFEWFALGAGVLFFIHHFQDEVTLWSKQRSLMRTFEQLPPVFLYTALTADSLLGTEFFTPATVATILIALSYGALSFMRRTPPDSLSAYFGLISLGLLAAGWTLDAIAPEVLLGSVILFHYIAWYVYFYYRFAKDPVKQYVYVREMLAIHALVLGAYAFFVYTTPGALWLGYIFTPIYFYIWAALHIIFSVRVSDYRAALKW